MRGGQNPRSKRASKVIPEEGPYRSYVGNLPNDTIRGDFDTLFDGLSIQNVHMMRDRETDNFKGFAYVEFATREDLAKAIELDGAEFDGKFIRIDVADNRHLEKRNAKAFPTRGGGRGGKGGGSFGDRGDRDHERGGFSGRGSKKPFFGQDSRGAHPPQHHHREPEIDESGFQKVERGGHHRGNRRREHGFGGHVHDAPRSHHRRSEPMGPHPTLAASEPDPNRPRLNLKPRTEDPEELERRRQQDEEELKQRLEKICTVKRDDE